MFSELKALEHIFEVTRVDCTGSITHDFILHYKDKTISEDVFVVFYFYSKSITEFCFEIHNKNTYNAKRIIRLDLSAHINNFSINGLLTMTEDYKLSDDSCMKLLNHNIFVRFIKERKEVIGYIYGFYDHNEIKKRVTRIQTIKDIIRE